MQKYIIEGLGTFFLVLISTLVADEWYPLAIGAILTGMTYSGMQATGAHFNPAISVAHVMRNKMLSSDLPIYLLTQIVGAVLAALIGGYLYSCTGRPALIHSVSSDPIGFVLAEFFGAFALTFVFMRVSTERHAPQILGLAVGLTMAGLAYALRPISGAIFNPAVAIGTCISTGAWGEMLYFLIGQLFGAAAASTISQILDTEENSSL
jgi:aquaporin Z